MRFAAALLALLPAVAQATITITGPSASAFWVQNTSNVITWTSAAGDPSPVDIVIVNSQNATLNGAFSIQNSVDLSNGTFTVTNVTLRVGDNYAVEFVNPQNISQVLATSASFSVMPAGTSPAPTSSSGAASTGSSSGSSTVSGSASSASGTSPSSSSGSPSPSASTTANAAPRILGVLSTQNVFSVAAMCGIASVAALFL